MANQPNKRLFTYTDDAGHVWNKMGEDQVDVNSVSGQTPLTAGAPIWPKQSRRYQVRKALYQDPTTFRAKTVIMYTAAAASAAATAALPLPVPVQGNTGTVNYNFVGLIPEKRPRALASRQLADHA